MPRKTTILYKDGDDEYQAVSEDTPLPVDATVTAEVEDGLSVKMQDGTTASQKAAVDTHGSQAVTLKDSAGNAINPVSGVEILDKDGVNKLVIDSNGKVTITNASFGVSSITAGETHIGEVGGSTAQIQPTVTVDTAIYGAGDCIGGKLTLTNAMRISGGTGLLQSLFLMDRSGTQKPALEILIFNADPSASTLTDNAAVSIHADDVSKIIRRMSVAASDWVLVGGIYIADLSPGSRVLAAVGSANLYAAIVAVGTPDFVAATDLSVRFGILRD